MNVTATMATVTMAALGLLPITAPMSPFPMARLLATIPRKLAVAFTLPMLVDKTGLARIRLGSTLREEQLPLM